MLKKIIYIAGFGYSGSTLLERLLASHPNIIGCGEVHNLKLDFEINERCSCGSALDSCAIWSFVHKEYLMKNSVDSYKAFEILSTTISSDIVYLCDSSKTTWGNMLRP